MDGEHWGAYGGGAGVSAAVEVDLVNNIEIVVLANTDNLVAERISGRVLSYIKKGTYEPIKPLAMNFAYHYYNEKGKDKFVEEIQDTHLLFKEFVAQARPNIDIDKVATGEVWFGKRAIEHKLVDELNTSDDHLMKLCATADVFQVRFELKKSFGERISEMTVKTSTNVVSNLVQKLTSSTSFMR